MKKRYRSSEKKENPDQVNCDALYDGRNSLVDRISCLPDELLCHILSFLPIKQAFITSLLSNQWTPLCYSLHALLFDYVMPNAYTFPVFSLDDQTEKDNEINDDDFYRFCSFVNTLMLSPLSTNQPLKTFRLSSVFGFLKGLGNRQRDCHVEVFKPLLEAAKRRGVEELDLSLSYHTFNPTIFISRTLVVLRLQMLYIASDTSCADLPSLKALDLRYVYFKDRNDYIKFLSACPIIQDLHVENIYIQSEMHRDENNASEEGLRSLTLSKLLRASFSSMDPLFNGIDNVEFLSITTGFTEASFNVITVFTNLIHIELTFFYNDCWDGVVELLRQCPKLQILSIIKFTRKNSSKEWKCPISVLECISSHLRPCTLLYIDGSANDLRFATYILQNACVLQDMTIVVDTGSSNGKLLGKDQIVEELSSCPKISPECKLLFN